PRLQPDRLRQRQVRNRDRTEVFRGRTGDPRDRARVQARPPRLRLGEVDPAGRQRPRRCHPVDPEGRHGRPSGSRTERRRRAPLPGVLGVGTDNKNEDRKMSRIGKKPIPVPSGVTASVNGQTVTAKGPKGELSFVVNEEVLVKLDNGQISVEPRDQSKDARSKWGMSRTQIVNIVHGVKDGFEKRLEINGVGYRASLQGKNLQLALGYSHDVVYE